MLPVAIFAIFLVLIIAGGIYSHQKAKARLEALQSVASAQGWHFSADRDGGHDEQFQQFDIFRKGNGRYAYNTLSGQTEIMAHSVPFKAGDYHYETTSRDSKGHTSTHHHHLSYLVAQIPYSGTPDIAIRPEGIFDKVSAFFGFDDIDFESVEFSDKFHVSSSDKRFAYDVVHPRMMEFLLATRGPTLSTGRGFACVTTGSCWEPNDFTRHLAWLQEFFQHWPDHVQAKLQDRA